VLQNAEPETAKAEFPPAESGLVESPEPEAEIEVEPPQCVEESISETPVTEAVAESPDDEAESAAELSKATPAAPDQAVIDCTQEAPEVCFGFLALAHMHSRSGGPHETKMSSAVCIWQNVSSLGACAIKTCTQQVACLLFCCCSAS